MRIAYITSFYPPERIAGAELGTHFMAKHMAEKGHEVHVIVTRPKSPVYRLESRAGYQIHWMPYWNVPAMRFFSEVRQALGILKRIQPELIHANCLLPGGYIAAKAGKKLQCPSLVLCYGYDVSDITPLQAKFFGIPALNGVAQVMGATRYACGKIHELSSQVEARVFYAGCDIDAFPLLPQKTPGESKKLLSIGRLIPEKGFRLLLETLAELDATYHLEIVGSGKQKAELLDLSHNLNILERITFTDHVPNHLLGEKFSQCDAFVLASEREPFGVVCIEAICSGVAVVCSHVMGLPEAVQEGRNGILVKSRQARDWADAITKTCEDAELRKSMHDNATADREKWSWKTRLEELEGIYAEMTAT